MSYTNRRHGFESEFAHLVKEHEHHLQVLAFRATKCEQMAKDIVQDVFLKLWEQGENYYQIENINAWLYRVTENKLIDHLRRTAADRRLKQKTWNRIQEISNETEINLTAKESAQCISRAIDNLPEQRKLIFKLNRQQMLNYNEIARTLRISRHTVKNQISTALHNLREHLKNLRLF